MAAPVPGRVPGRVAAPVRTAAGAVFLAGLLSACATGGATSPSQDPAAAEISPEPATSSPPDGRDATGAREATDAPSPEDHQVAEPATVRLPRLGIDATLDPLTLDDAGRLRAPEYGRAGWYRAGPEPGEPGPAVIAGHVDSRTGPDVFYPLSSSREGDEILVERVDGTTAAFRVTQVERHPREDFPTERVYGDTPDVQLRLITCGGEYDRGGGGYRDNVVVFAELVA